MPRLPGPRTAAYAVPMLALLLGGAAFVTAQTPRVQLGLQPDGSYLVPSNQSVTPAGTVRRVERSRPKDLAISPDGGLAAVLCTNQVLFYTLSGDLQGSVSLAAGALGLAWMPDGSALFASTTAGKVARLEPRAGKWQVAAELVPDIPTTGTGKSRKGGANPQANGLAVSPDGKRLFVALGIRNAVAVLDLPEGKVTGSVAVGAAPYHLALSSDGRTLAAANRGGTLEREGGKDTEPSAGTPIRVDRDTDSVRAGTVSLIDTETLAAREVEVGRQPSGMVFSADNKALYVTNSDEDTVSIVDPRAGKERQKVSIRPQDDARFGQIPTGAALSADGDKLFVSCGGANSVAVVELARRPRVLGYVPTGWFPIALAERQGRLVVASSKGLGGRLEGITRYGIGPGVGTVQFLGSEVLSDVTAQTRQVARNNHWGEELEARKGVAAVPIPERVGEPSLFRHVVYIIKENHTYDSTLGDMPEGNGDPKLTVFPDEVTPNHHALARQYVLLDNTYASGTNSADGHQWTDSAGANAYMEQHYGTYPRSYPYDGGDPLSSSPAGFLWTTAHKAGRSVRVYGEFVNKPKVVDPATGKAPNWERCWKDYTSGENRIQVTAETDSLALRPYIHPHYIGWPITVSDQWRASQFLADLADWTKAGKMPDLSILELPCDHTTGTSPGYPTPRASVADNDLAFGRIVEGISNSPFWKDTLILTIEDDSQLGLDHVDGHRTIAFCVSPYTRRGSVVSEPYNHTSLLRTIELVLGMPAMTRFDRTATPLTACFGERADVSPFKALANRVPLDEMNPPKTALRGEALRLAEACSRLDWSGVDRADAGVVARAVWSTRKPGKPFPVASFHAIEDDDD